MHNREQVVPGFLVAVPQLDDPNFARSVIYLISHSEEGAFGLVLNRPAGIQLGDVCREFGLEADRGDPVHIGGPVDEHRGFLLHKGEPEDESEAVEPGICISGDPDLLQRCCLNDDQGFRLFVGYSGWGPGQLEAELTSGAWLMLPSRAEHVFANDPDGLWERVLRDAGIDPATIAPGGGVN